MIERISRSDMCFISFLCSCSCMVPCMHDEMLYSTFNSTTNSHHRYLPSFRHSSHSPSVLASEAMKVIQQTQAISSRYTLNSSQHCQDVYSLIRRPARNPPFSREAFTVKRVLRDANITPACYFLQSEYP